MSGNLSSAPIDLFASVEEALNGYHAGELDASPFANLALFRHERRKGVRNIRKITNLILNNAWAVLQKREPEEAKFIQKRFFDQETMQAVANQLNVSEGHVYVWRKRAITSLAAVLDAMDAATGQFQ